MKDASKVGKGEETSVEQEDGDFDERVDVGVEEVEEVEALTLV